MENGRRAPQGLLKDRVRDRRMLEDQESRLVPGGLSQPRPDPFHAGPSFIDLARKRKPAQHQVRPLVHQALQCDAAHLGMIDFPLIAGTLHMVAKGCTDRCRLDRPWGTDRRRLSDQPFDGTRPDDIESTTPFQVRSGDSMRPVADRHVPSGAGGRGPDGTAGSPFRAGDLVPESIDMGLSRLDHAVGLRPLPGRHRGCERGDPGMETARQANASIRGWAPVSIAERPPRHHQDGKRTSITLSRRESH